MKNKRLATSRLALEKRIVFDAAAVQTTAEALPDVVDASDVDALAHNLGSADAETETLLAALAPAPRSETGTLVVVDAAVEDYQTLLAGVEDGAEVVVLDAGRDGVAQISDLLSERGGVTELHIVSHGDVGQVILGNAELSLNSLDGYSDVLQSWRAALSDGADILLYGCQVGDSADGAEFVDRLAELTGADIAASDDLTGAAELGGDWDLEMHRGDVAADLVFAGWALSDYDHVLLAVSFDGGGDGISWSDPLNWDNDLVPGSVDDVTINSFAVDVFTTETITTLTVDTGGALILSAGGDLTVAGPTTVLNGSNLDFQNGTLNTGGGVVDMTSMVFMNGGTFNTLSTLDLNGTALLDAGRLQGMGSPVNNSGIVAFNPPTVFILDGITFTNNNFTDWNAGNLRLDNGTVFANSVGGVVDIDGPASRNVFTFTGAPGSIVNDGIINRVSPGNVDFSVDYTSTSGSLDFTDGTISLQAGGTFNGGDANFTGPGLLRFAAGSYTLNDGTSFNGGAGTVRVDGAFVGVNSSVTPVFSDTQFELVSGTLQVGMPSVFFDNAGTFRWQGGNLDIVAGGTFTNQPGGTFFLQGDLIATGGGVFDNFGIFDRNAGVATASFGTVTVNNFGNFVVSNGTYENQSNFNFLGGSIDTQPGATFRNSSLLDVQGDHIVGGTGVFENAATFQRSAGGGALTVNSQFNNTPMSSVLLQTGILALHGGGTNAGTFSLDSGTTLEFDVNPYVFDQSTGSLATVGSLVRINGGGLDVINGNLTIGAPDLLELNGGALNILGAMNVIFLGGTFNHNGGVLGGDGDFLVQNFGGTYNWFGGVQGGSGRTIMQGGGPDGILNIDGGAGKAIDGRLLINDSAINVVGTGTIDMINGATIDNNSTLSLLSDADFFNTAGPAAINNTTSGTVIKSMAPGVSEIRPRLDNDGTVSAFSGILQVLGDGIATGTFSAGAGAELQFAPTAPYALQPVVLFTGAGISRVTGGTVDVTGNTIVDNSATLVLDGGTININAMSVLNIDGTFVQNGGVVTDPGAPTATLAINALGVFDWNGGIQSGGGDTDVSSGGGVVNLNLGGGQLLTGGRSLSNNSLVLVNGIGTLDVTGSSSVFNTGTWDFQDDGNVGSSDFTGFFNNSGALFKSAGPGTSSFMQINLLNQGTVQIDSGSLELDGISDTISTGTFQGAGTLRFGLGSHSVQAGTSVNMAGSVEFTNGNTVIDGSYSVGGTTLITGGIVDFNTNVLIPDLVINGPGGLGGTGDVNLTGTFDWSEGFIDGTGAFNVNNAGAINGPGLKVLNGRTLSNNVVMGALDWNGGDIDLINGAVISNNTSFDIRTSSTMFNSVGSATFVNTPGAVLFRSTTAGFADIDAFFANSGTVNLATGNLGLFGGGNHSVNAAFNVAPGSELEFGGGLHILNGVDFNGGGQLTVTGGVLEVASNLNTFNTALGVAPGGTLRLSGGTLGGSGNVFVGGMFDWVGGRLTGTGSFTVGAAASFSVNASPMAPPLLDGRVLTNLGTGDAVNAPNNWQFINGAVFDNQGAFDIGANITDLGGGVNRFLNNGAVQMSSGGTSQVDVGFDNAASGIVSVANGSLVLAGGGAGDGSFSIAALGTLIFDGIHDLGPSTVILGAGAIGFVSGSSVTFSSNTVTTNRNTTVSSLWNNGPLIAGSLTQPANGSVAFNGNSFDYTPVVGFTGTDSFNFTTTGAAAVGNATVLVDVTVNAGGNLAPVANDDTFSATENTPLTQLVSALLVNDADANGDILTVTAATQPANGSLTFGTDQNGDPIITYSPNSGFSGTDSFSYTIDDGFGGSDVATVFLEVGAVNDAPVANDDMVTTSEDTPVVIPPLLANDTDPDGDTLQVLGNTQPQNGTLTPNPSGPGQIYTPNPDFFGIDTFNYAVGDGNGATDSATVRIAVQPVNDAPAAVDSSFATTADTPVSGQLAGIASDADGDALQTTVTGMPGNGTVSISGDGTFTYVPDSGFVGADSFTLQFDDGNGGLASSVVTISVDPLQSDGPITWTNQSGDGDWNNPSNWNQGRVPQDGDDVVIPELPGGITFNAGTVSLNSLTVFDTLNVTGGSISIAAPSVVEAGGRLTIANAAFGGAGALVNRGEIVLANAVVGAGLTNNADISVAGQSSISGPFGNEVGGRLSVTGNLTVTQTGASFVNLGGINIAAGGRLAVDALGFTNGPSGVIQGNGTLDVNGTTFVNAGRVEPGQSPGVLTINGNYRQAPSGVLLLEIGGRELGTRYDRLVVVGTLTLDGTVVIQLVGGYLPAAEDNVQVLQATNIGGQPANFIVQGAPGGSAVAFSLTAGGLMILSQPVFVDTIALGDNTTGADSGTTGDSGPSADASGSDTGGGDNNGFESTPNQLVQDVQDSSTQTTSSSDGTTADSDDGSAETASASSDAPAEGDAAATGDDSGSGEATQGAAKDATTEGGAQSTKTDGAPTEGDGTAQGEVTAEGDAATQADATGEGDADEQGEDGGDSEAAAEGEQAAEGEGEQVAEGEGEEAAEGEGEQVAEGEQAVDEQALEEQIAAEVSKFSQEQAEVFETLVGAAAKAMACK